MRSPSTGAVEDISSALFHQRALFESAVPAGGLRMAQDQFLHEPVLLDEVVELFAPVPAGWVVDATVGGGGHTAAVLAARPELSVLGLDRDPDAVTAARARLAPFGSRAAVRQARFDELAEAAGSVAGTLSGVLFDLGVSSPQLDRAERGFSYRAEGPLDMRMDPTAGRDAASIVNEATEAELAVLFAAHGEGRLARRLARAVVAARPVTSTAELAEVVAAAVPAAVRRRGHPARRVFQALRATVNEELEQLAATLPVALELLAVGGRCLAIAYHSGEDRLVKAAFAQALTGGCVCPPGLPCVCGAVPKHRLVFRGARRPSPDEVARNHRAAAARLRAIERTAA
ncbi:MAG TPA: 16S rRNA (cytosine(1402)-N(4))-methyltransferase RsmH [Acidimicrobiales bacterium]|nr:16S rRNA (cytosine(1402)-N(4))-methyltransferase RsmH [Acidimicrobiales bacterium]